MLHSAAAAAQLPNQAPTAAQEHVRCSLELAALRGCLDAEQRAGMARAALATLRGAAAGSTPASPTTAPLRTGGQAPCGTPECIACSMASLLQTCAEGLLASALLLLASLRP